MLIGNSMEDPSRSVVITGIGAVTPFGLGVKTLWSELLAGRSAISNIQRFDTTEFPVHFAGEIHGWDEWVQPIIESKELKRLDRPSQFAIACCDEAIGQSGCIGPVDPSRIGVVFGSGVGGLEEIESQHGKLLEKGPSKLSPFLIGKIILNASAGNLAIRYGAQGPAMALATACATGANAIGEAMEMIRAGRADCVIAGGTEAAITPVALGGFSQMKALSRRNDAPQQASRPFDRHRDGFVMAEGAGCMVLESESGAKGRGATILGRLLGYGASCDAHHMSAPDPQAHGVLRAMRIAQSMAKTAVDRIDYVNAHATSTPVGDLCELKALSQFFEATAEKPSLSSTKGHLGHSLGATGAIEAILSLMSIREGVALPTLNCAEPEPGFPFDLFCDAPRARHIRIALSNSFGFGGHNATLVLGSMS
jgi:3-oxoacyl-[acyl-carrier-protein] synthase II